jgi:hypothetical protein
MRKTLCILGLAAALAAAAQEPKDRLTLSGSLQTDVLIPQTDSVIGAAKDGDWAKTNTYVDLLLQSRYVEAGARLEYLEHPLPQFQNEAGYRGWGVPHGYVKGKTDKGDLTLGTFYEQFGSGFILRAYEDRPLGIDNSLLGARVKARPLKGVQLTALYGRQRVYWDWPKAYIGGGDAEVNLDEWLPALQKSDTRLMLGASWVNKKEEDENIPLPPQPYRLNLPKYVNAWDVRAQLNHGAWSLLGEYARKGCDPSADNNYTYRPGHVAMLSATYSKKGLSMLVQAKRSENMSFRSQRSRKGIPARINHLQAFTLDHTYALAALYAYDTQMALGEWAYQAELGYNFKRKTTLGGRYGMQLKVNYSYVRSIDHDYVAAADLRGTDWFHSSFWKWGPQAYYQDLDIQLQRKMSKSLKLNLMYMNQRYNQAVIEGHGEPMIHSDVFVADARYQFSPKATLRGEAQYLSTDQDQGDWVFGLLELSLVPHWMFTVSDMYNCGTTHVHYYQGLVTYTTGAHRLQAGYGRTRAGINCSGGVCRYVPASRGFTLSYNYNF